MNPAIAVENLIRTYGSLTAVDSVSFEVRPGEILELIGPRTGLCLRRHSRNPAGADDCAGGYGHSRARSG